MKKGPPRIVFLDFVMTSPVNAARILSQGVRNFIDSSVSNENVPRARPAGATLTIGDDDTHSCNTRNSGLVCQSFPLLKCHNSTYYLIMSENMSGAIHLCPGDERPLNKETFAELGSSIDKKYKEDMFPRMRDTLHIIHLVEGSCGVVLIGRLIICFSVHEAWSNVPLNTFVPENAVPPLLSTTLDYRDKEIEAAKKATVGVSSSQSLPQPKAN